MEVRKSKKHHSFDGRYSEKNVKDLFKAIAVGNRELITDLLDSDRSLIGTPYEVQYEKYSDFLDDYIMKTEEMLPLKWATIIGNPDIINLLRTYGVDGRSKSKKARSKRRSRSKKARSKRRSRSKKTRSKGRSRSKKVRKSKRTKKY